MRDQPILHRVIHYSIFLLRWDQDLELQRHVIGHDQRTAPLNARVGSNYATIQITGNR